MAFFVKGFFISFVLFYGLMPVASSAVKNERLQIKTVSNYDYHTTRLRLLKSVEQNGLVLFGEFDHAKAAQDKGLQMPPTSVLIFGNPKGGTPLMLDHPELALDLPFRVLISQQRDGVVFVSYHPSEDFLAYGLDTRDIEPFKKLELLVQNAIK